MPKTVITPMQVRRHYNGTCICYTGKPGRNCPVSNMTPKDQEAAIRKHVSGIPKPKGV